MGNLGEIPTRTSMSVYYKFNGNPNDSSGNGKNAAATNMTYPLSSGRFSQGASFNGTTGMLQTVLSVLPASFTISLWIYPIPSSDDYGCIVANNGTIGVYYRGISKKLSYYSGGDHLSNYVFTENKWYHICISVTSNVGTLYINGKLDTALGTVQSFVPIYIGNDEFSENFKGNMDELIIENRAWSSSEIRKYYTQAKGRLAPQ